MHTSARILNHNNPKADEMTEFTIASFNVKNLEFEKAADMRDKLKLRIFGAGLEDIKY